MGYQVLVVFGVEEVHEVVVGDEFFGFFEFVGLVFLEPPDSFQGVLVDELVPGAADFLDERSGHGFLEIVLVHDLRYLLGIVFGVEQL